MIPEVSPCGYPVDLLRTCYATDVRFYRDDPRTSRIRWYRVPADRPFLPVPTIFASSIYDHLNEFRQPVGQVGQGEQLLAERPWVDGGNPDMTRWVEGRYCGTEAQWRGDMYTPPLLPVVGDCCRHGNYCRQFFPEGGPRFIHSDFRYDPPAGSGLPTLIFPPEGVPRAAFTPVGTCAWNVGGVVVPFWQLLLDVSTTLNYNFVVEDLATLFSIIGLVRDTRPKSERVKGPLWDGYSPFTMPIAPSRDAPGLPATITLTGSD